MNEMPERIWADQSVAASVFEEGTMCYLQEWIGFDPDGTHVQPGRFNTEYVRADLYTALLKERDELDAGVQWQPIEKLESCPDGDYLFAHFGTLLNCRVLHRLEVLNNPRYLFTLFRALAQPPNENGELYSEQNFSKKSKMREAIDKQMEMEG